MAAAAGSVPQFASLYVGDLHSDVTEAMLYEVFNSVGPVGSIRVCRDSVTRRSLGYGYVNFHAVADAERALDTLNYSSIKGRACRIMWSQRDPSLRKSGAGNVYVKNLDRSIDNKALYDTFSLFGNILSCKVAADRDGKSHGYGFVHYETEEAAKQAIERVHGMQIGEKTVHVSSFLKRDEREPTTITNYTNLYVKNLPDDFDDDKINKVFGAYGTITSSVLMADPKDRKFAFINFEAAESAIKCVEEMHEKDLRTEEQKSKPKEDGEDEFETLYVQRAQTKAERARAFKQQNAANIASKPQAAQGVNLYVKNLDEDTDEDSFRALFEPFGTLTSVAAMKDEKGKCKGFGFVSFSSPDDATKAVTEMHLKVVKGKPLYVGLAEKKEAREERLKSRYSAGAGPGKGMKGGKGGKGGMSPQMMGGMNPQMMGGMGGMGGMMGGMGGNPMMGNPMMGNPMMGNPMMGKGGPMMGGPQMGKGPMMGGPQMNPQMMQMMQQKGQQQMNPQMMQMMQQKGQQQMMNPQMMGKGMPGMMPGGAPMGMNPQMMGKGMPGMMPQGGKPMGAPMPQQQQAPQQPMQPAAGAPLNASALAAAPPAVQKQMIGEKLYPAIAKHHPEMAGKVTGMMLEMDNSELLMLLESEPQMRAKINEALVVLGGK